MITSNVIAGCITFYLLAHVFLVLITCCIIDIDEDSIFNVRDYGFSFVNPWFVYLHSKLNIFGCFLVSISLLCIFPIYGICYWIYFATHIGRDNYHTK